MAVKAARAFRASRDTRLTVDGCAFVLLGSRAMRISARNQLTAKVRAITLGDVMAEVVLEVGGQELVSVITRASAEHLGLAAGDEVTAIIKSTEVMLGK
jgi:molybdopterin-binding protein